MTKSSATVDENDWTFGQVLPAFLLIGPIATAVKGAFDEQSTRIPSGLTRSITPTNTEQADDIETVTNDLEHADECAEMREFREHVSECLKRNYYNTATCPWIITVFCLMCVQVLEATVLMFLELVVQRSSATNALFAVVYLILIISPTAVYLLILLCLIFEHFGTDNRKCLVPFSVFISVVAFGLYSMYPVWGVLYSPKHTEPIFRIGQDFIIVGVSFSIIGMVVVGHMTAHWIFGKNFPGF